MEKQIEKQIEQQIAKRIAKFIAIGIAGIIAITIFIFLGGKVVQLLWNWLMPMLFGLREADVLAGRRHAGAEPHPVRRPRDRGGHRWPRWGRDMTPRRRERFRQRMRDAAAWAAPEPAEHAPQ